MRILLSSLLTMSVIAGAFATATPAHSSEPCADDACVVALVDRLHTCKSLECDVVEQLTAIGSGIWPAIQAGLAVERPEMTRFWTLGVLSEVRIVASRPVLAALLKSDRTVRIRAAAAFALGPHRSREVASMLAVGLADRDVNVRFEVASAMALSHSPKVVPALLKALRDKDTDVRGAVLDVLTLEADSRAVMPILRRVQRDKVPEIRGRAAIALANHQVDAKVAALLLPRLQSETDINALAALCFCLGELGDSSFVAPLAALSVHVSPVVTKHAADAAARIQQRLDGKP